MQGRVYKYYKKITKKNKRNKQHAKKNNSSTYCGSLRSIFLKDGYITRFFTNVSKKNKISANAFI